MRGMRAFTYTPGPRLYIGEGRQELALAHLPSGKTLFVTDRGIRNLGLCDRYLHLLRDAGVETVIFDDVEADPSAKTLLAAVAAGRTHQVGSVIGFGGGSPMDVAKLAAYLLGSGDRLEDLWGVERAAGERLPLVLVPTTAGTGSEASQFSVITGDEGQKLAVNARVLIPDCAVLDAGLTLGLPRYVTAASGVDAIVHAVEAYGSRLRNPLSDALAREALRLLCANLIKACDTPSDLAAREAMLLGAHLAGLAFANASVAGVHALAYPLGGVHHVPHGVANALMLRHVLMHNLEASSERYAELADLLALGAGSATTCVRAMRLIDHLHALVVDSGIPPRLRDHGVLADDLPRLAAEAMKGERMLAQNPRPIGEEDARRLYAAAF